MSTGGVYDEQFVPTGQLSAKARNIQSVNREASIATRQTEQALEQVDTERGRFLSPISLQTALPRKKPKRLEPAAESPPPQVLYPETPPPPEEGEFIVGGVVYGWEVFYELNEDDAGLGDNGYYHFVNAVRSMSGESCVIYTSERSTLNGYANVDLPDFYGASTYTEWLAPFVGEREDIISMETGLPAGSETGDYYVGWTRDEGTAVELSPMFICDVVDVLDWYYGFFSYKEVFPIGAGKAIYIHCWHTKSATEVRYYPWIAESTTTPAQLERYFDAIPGEAGTAVLGPYDPVEADTFENSYTATMFGEQIAANRSEDDQGIKCILIDGPSATEIPAPGGLYEKIRALEKPYGIVSRRPATEEDFFYPSGGAANTLAQAMWSNGRFHAFQRPTTYQNPIRPPVSIFEQFYIPRQSSYSYGGWPVEGGNYFFSDDAYDYALLLLNGEGDVADGIWDEGSVQEDDYPFGLLWSESQYAWERDARLPIFRSFGEQSDVDSFENKITNGLGGYYWLLDELPPTAPPDPPPGGKYPSDQAASIASEFYGMRLEKYFVKIPRNNDGTYSSTYVSYSPFYSQPRLKFTIFLTNNLELTFVSEDGKESSLLVKKPPSISYGEDYYGEVVLDPNSYRLFTDWRNPTKARELAARLGFTNL